jgi:hypothetical protein
MSFFSFVLYSEPFILWYLRETVKYKDEYLSLGKRTSNMIKSMYAEYMGLHFRNMHGWGFADYKNDL